jgi:hypothetical protein
MLTQHQAGALSTTLSSHIQVAASASADSAVGWCTVVVVVT